MKKLWIIENSDFKTNYINIKKISKKYKIWSSSTFQYTLNVKRFGFGLAKCKSTVIVVVI